VIACGSDMVRLPGAIPLCDVDWSYTLAPGKKVMLGCLDPLLTRRLANVDRHVVEGSAAKGTHSMVTMRCSDPRKIYSHAKPSALRARI
jgi:hypothetical protein